MNSRGWVRRWLLPGAAVVAALAFSGWGQAQDLLAKVKAIGELVIGT